MSEILYIDAFSGISGDMFVGALLDLGAGSLPLLEAELAKLKLEGWSLQWQRSRTGGVSAGRFTVTVSGEGHRPRTYAEIKQLLGQSDLPERVRRQSLEVFGRLAQAEAQAHGEPLNRVHFHELGMVDSIVDIVAVCVLLAELAPQSIMASTIVTGSGFVETAHGLMPVPAPATALLLEGIPIIPGSESQELVTPTGAALAGYFADSFQPLPALRLGRVGYGAGTRKTQIPNLLRLITGSLIAVTGEAAPKEQALLETNIDDSTPEELSYLAGRLLEAGAADVWMNPVLMKKGRPGVVLSVLCPPAEVERHLDLIFGESSSFGVRVGSVKRHCLEREVKEVQTAFGTIKVKVGYWKGREVSASPEYEDCRRAALEANAPLTSVYEAAKKAWQEIKRLTFNV